jgi:hypothetical protein
MKKNRREFAIHDNSYDTQKIEFTISEISINIDSRLLNKMNRQNRG